MYVMRKQDGALRTEALRPTLFVPMTGRAEQTRIAKPDPLHPKLANGGFEEPLLESGFLRDWYYQRQVAWQTDPQAPEGQHFVRMHNEQPGKPARALQGFAVDGRHVSFLRVSAQVRYENVRPGRDNDEQAAIVVTFYDERRQELGHRWIGIFRGTQPWHRESEQVRVPRSAREAILRLGLFGAVGQIDFDDVQIRAYHR
jgi:protein-L-isoaspartate(D-aspartate) O-methyltransferase